MLITRYAKIVMSLVLAAFCLLVAFDNITDYGTNYLFVQHVMSMDTTFPWQCAHVPVDHQSRAVADRLRAHHRRRGRDRRSFPAGAIRFIQVRDAPGTVFNQ